MSQFPNAAGASEFQPQQGDRSVSAAWPVVRSPDPGSPGARLLAFLTLAVVVPLVVFFQQCEGGIKPSATPAQTAAAATTKELPDFDQFSMMGRGVLKVAQLYEGADKSKRAELLQVMDPAKSGPVIAPPLGPLERVRLAIAAGELDSATAAIERLDAIDFDKEISEWKPAPGLKSEDPDKARAEHEAEITELRHDAQTLKLVYAGKEGEIADEDHSRLVDRQGWWGRVATSFGKGDQDPIRLDALRGGGTLLVAIILFGVLVVGAVLAGFALAVVLLVLIASGKIRRRFVAPIPGGSVYLETLALFVLAFASLAFLKFSAASPNAALLAQWALVPVIFWPLLRGVPWSSFRQAMGYTSGGGVFKEIGCGVFAYLAGIPLFLFAAAVALLLLRIQARLLYGPDAPPPAPAPNNKVLELLTSANSTTLVLFFCLATFWAPLVEEAVFRGAFFRHLRSRVPMVVAAMGSAAVFGMMHGYPVPLLLPVMTLGFNFALMREWRGSLIAPMTAHLLHNGTLVGMMVTMMSALR